MVTSTKSKGRSGARNFIGKTNREKVTALKSKKSDFWKAVEGKNRIRIMPPRAGTDEVFVAAHMHYNVGIEEKAVPCLKLLDKRCYLCEVARTMPKEECDFYARRQFACNIFDYKNPEKIHVWTAGVKVFNDLMMYFGDSEPDFDDEENSDYGDITDPDEGRDVTIVRVGTTRNTTYTVQVAPNSTAWKPIIDEVIEKAGGLPDLHAILEFVDYKTQKAMYLAEAEDDDEDAGWDDEDEEEVKPSRSKRNLKTRAKASDPDDDEETDDDEGVEEDLDETEDSQEADDDDDDDDAEGEDDEDEAPVARGRAGRPARATAAPAGGRMASRLRDVAAKRGTRRAS